VAGGLAGSRVHNGAAACRTAQRPGSRWMRFGVRWPAARAAIAPRRPAPGLRPRALAPGCGDRVRGPGAPGHPPGRRRLGPSAARAAPPGNRRAHRGNGASARHDRGHPQRQGLRAGRSPGPQSFRRITRQGCWCWSVARGPGHVRAVRLITLLRSHRRLVRWRSAYPRQGGRPPVDARVAALVGQMAREPGLGLQTVQSWHRCATLAMKVLAFRQGAGNGGQGG